MVETVTIQCVAKKGSPGKGKAALGDEPKRVIMGVELPADVRATLEELQELLGMPQVKITRRLFQWYASQDDWLKSLIMRQYTRAVQADVARVILERMKGEMPITFVGPIPPDNPGVPPKGRRTQESP